MPDIFSLLWNSINIAKTWYIYTIWLMISMIFYCMVRYIDHNENKACELLQSLDMYLLIILSNTSHILGETLFLHFEDTVSICLDLCPQMTCNITRHWCQNKQNLFRHELCISDILLFHFNCSNTFIQYDGLWCARIDMDSHTNSTIHL